MSLPALHRARSTSYACDHLRDIGLPLCAPLCEPVTDAHLDHPGYGCSGRDGQLDLRCDTCQLFFLQGAPLPSANK